MKLNVLPALGFVLFTAASCSYSGDAKSGGTDSSSNFAFLRSTAFQPAAFDGLSGATALSIGNFSTNDGYPDIIVHTASAGLVYYANTEGEGFSAGVRINASFQNHSAAAVYSSQVIVTADQTNGTLRLLSNGNGTFTQVAGYDLPGTNVVSMAIAGNFVFAMTNPGNSFFSEFLQSDFGAAIPATEFNAVDGIARATDLDGDSYADIAAFAEAASVTPRLYRGSAASVPALVAGTPLTRSATSNVKDFTFGFLSSTSKPDIILISDSGVEFFSNQSSTGTFSFIENSGISISATGSHILAADFLNADGKIDLFISKSADTAKIYKQNALGTAFEDVTSLAFAESGVLAAGPLQIYTADFNGDGFSDIAELYSDASIRVYINNRKSL